MKRLRRAFPLSGAVLRLSALVLLLLLSVAAPVLPAEGDRPTGKSVTVRVEPKDAPAADEDVPQRLLDLTAGIRSGDTEWVSRYRETPDGALSNEARTTLKVATAEGYGRKECLKDIKGGGERTKFLYRNLDVGRHEILKQLYARALVETNRRLPEGSKPIGRVRAVNSGGTGDYTRDQDITLFIDDPVREKLFFEVVAEVAKAPPFGLEVDVKKTGGIDFPQIEVTFFPSRNDVPDSRFATDVEAFKLSYTEVLARQKADVEAYLGGGTDIEVKGRRRPGQMYVQEVATGPEGKIRYRTEVPGNAREAGAIFSDFGAERFHKWQRASHVFSDYLQGWQHARGEDHDPSKGPLKYLGRVVEQLCHIDDRPVWDEKTPMDDKIETVRRIWPDLDPTNPDHRRLLAKRVEVFEIGLAVKTTKKLPPGVDGERMTMAAKILLRKSVAATAGEMAETMLRPPAWDSSMLHPTEKAKWDRMTPEEHTAFAAKRDEVYRRCVQHESMENLLLTIEMLRRLDAMEAKTSRRQDGEAAIRRMIALAPPDVQDVLKKAAGYTDVAARLFLAETPDAKRAVRAELVDTRWRLQREMPEVRLTGEEFLRQMETLGPEKFLAKAMAGERTPLPPRGSEIEERFRQHLEDAFPTVKQEYEAFEQKLAKLGKKGYVLHRLKEETFQLDTVSDFLTLVEMYQGDATGWQYAEFLMTNVLSRVHWSFGQLIAASKVDSTEALKVLGKNLVFMSLSRLVPWAGQAKLVFDIGRGLVQVTVGWSVNVANADLVDALYTGEAGRTIDGAAGTKQGALRDSGFCVLPESCVIRKEKKGGELQILIDRAGVYEHAFRKWTGLDPYAIGDRGDVDPKIAILIRLHDRLAELLIAQANEIEPTWVYSTKTPRLQIPLDPEEVDSAVKSALVSFTNRCGREVERVHSESGARSYKSIFDEEDAIVRGLRERYVSDVLSGMIDAWQTRITARVLAMRQIERAAVHLDYAGLAEGINGAVGKWLSRGPATEPGVAPAYELDVQVNGVLVEKDVYDGGEPVRVSGFLRGSGDVGERPPNVRIEVLPGTVRILAKREGGDPAKVEPGDLVEDTVLVRAVPEGGGTPLAEAKEKVRILLPAEDPGETRTLPVLRHEERRSDGSLYEAFEYLKSFLGMPGDWVEDSGYVYHGPYEVYGPDEQKQEDRTYEFGVLDGKTRSYDREGNLVHEIPYVDGRRQGLERRLDPESDARLEIDWVDDWLAEQRSYSEEGQLLRRITYREVENPEDPWANMSGTAEAWHGNGAPRWRGAYERTDQDLSERGGWNGETISGKTGEWEWWFMDGTPERRATYRENVLHGRLEEWFENGNRKLVTHFVEGKETGGREVYHENGKLEEKGEVVDGRKNGTWELFDEEGRLRTRGGFADGVREGAWEEFDAEGETVAKGAWEEDEKTGPWLETWNWGREEARGSYEAGERVGPWTHHIVDGETRYLAEEQIYEGGKLHGDYVSYAPDGRVKSKGRYEEGARTGRWVFTDEWGSREEGDYKEGERTGAWRFYSRSFEGREYLVAKGSYEEGYREGRWTFHDEEGKQTGWEEYRGGEVVDEGK